MSQWLGEETVLEGEEKQERGVMKLVLQDRKE